MIQSYPIKSETVLTELLPNLLQFKTKKYLIASKAVKFLKLKDCQEFSKMVVDRLIRNEIFNRELEVFEHFIQFVLVFTPLEPAFETILK